MSKLPDNVSKLPKRGESVASLADIKALVPRAKDYTVVVIKDGKKVTGLTVKVTPAGRKVYRLVAKSPNSGRNVTKSQLVEALSFKKAVEWAVRTYAEIKQGQHDKGTDVEEQARQEYEAELNTPIIELARKRADANLAQGKISQYTYKQDCVDIKHLEALLGRLTFLEFGRETAKSLGRDIKDDNTKLDKIPKLINKTYNSLSPKVQERLPYVPKKLLADELPRHKPAKKTNELIPRKQFGLFWSRLVRADVAQVHKDIALMCLLTGERVEAVVSSKVENINHEERYIYMEGKGSNGEITKNPVPITNYLGLLLTRLADGRKEGYLFPPRRTAKAGVPNVKPHMSEPSRKLFDDLGSYDNVKRLSSHSFRRTLANVVATAIGGNQAVADQHVLHLKQFTTNAGPHYLDSKSKEFLDARRYSYQRGHELLNELIVSQGMQAGADVYDWKKWEEDGYPKTSPYLMLAQALKFPAEMSVKATDCGDKESERVAIVSFGEVDEDNVAISAKVTSPLAFMCKGGPVRPVTVSATEYRMIWDALPTTMDFISNHKDKILHEFLGIEPKPKLPNYEDEFK